MNHKLLPLLFFAMTGFYGHAFQANDAISQTIINQLTESTAARASNAQISASPTSLVVPPGETRTTTISWSSVFTSPSIWVSMDGRPATLFASGRSGSKAAPWIVAGRTYVFTLYPGGAPIFPSASVTVQGIAVTGSISANPVSVSVPSGQLGTTTLSWFTNGTNTQTYVSNNGAPETLFASGRTGSQQAPWIQANRTYTFRLYAGTSHTHLLDSLVVQGIGASGQLTANPTVVYVAPGSTGTTSLGWQLQNVTSGQIRYQVNQGSEIFFRNVSGSAGTVVFQGVREGRTYQFRLYPSGSSVPVATATVRGENTFGFADSGLLSAKVRTEFRAEQVPQIVLNPSACPYTDQSIGPIINPGACEQIPPGGVTFSAENVWQQNGGFNASEYWIMGMNTELDPYSACNTGPPNMSEPNSGIDFKTGGPNGRYGFQMQRDSAGSWRAHLALDNRILAPQANCLDENTMVPFLSVGAHHGFGNPTPVGVLNPSGAAPTATEFKARIWDYDTNSTFVDFNIFALTEWGGVVRGIFLRLVYEGSMNPPREQPLKRFWNWPVEGSIYYPGADYAFFDSEFVDELCDNIIEEIPRMRPCSSFRSSPGEVCGMGRDITYRIDWQALFECASSRGLFAEPLPQNQSDIPINGVHWDVEAYGDSGTPEGSALWMSIHDMRMVRNP